MKTKGLLNAVLVAIAAILFVACDNEHTPTPEPKPEPTPEVYEWYYAIDEGEPTELCSMLYLKNDTGDYGYQYVIALTKEEGMESIKDVQSCQEYIFLSLGEESFQSLMANGSFNPVSTTDPLYMFYVNTEELYFEDYVDNHSMISSASISASTEEATDNLLLELYYVTLDGEEFHAVAKARQIIIEEPVPDYDSYFNYTLDCAESSNSIGAAFYSTTPSGTLYTLCVGNAHTFATIEDSVLLQLSIDDILPMEEFEFDIATSSTTFKLRFYNPLTEYNLTIDNKFRGGCEGTISLRDGALRVEFTNTPPNGNDVLSLSALCGTNGMRSVSECMDIYDGEHTPLFTPRSVVIHNRGVECSIYVSSQSDITTVEGMADAEVVIFCPEGGWEKLLTGLFMAGSSFPDMSITLNGESYMKSNCAGLNCRIPTFNTDTNTLTLIANTYTNVGGMALYYDGAFTLIE